jgi:hypothetical protein
LTLTTPPDGGTQSLPNKSNLTVFFFCPESVGLFGGVDLALEFFRIDLVPPLKILKNLFWIPD